MPDIIIAQNVPVDKLSRIVTAYVALHGPIPMSTYVPAIRDANGAIVTAEVLPAPLYTPAQFFRKCIMDGIRNCVRLYERDLAGKAAGDTAAAIAADDFKNF